MDEEKEATQRVPTESRYRHRDEGADERENVEMGMSLVAGVESCAAANGENHGGVDS